jgi:twitching motility protein PilJ
VQDLANQAADATRRIGALINAIQTDIQGAGAAMKKTTDEALRGAELAESTGEVLAEINDVSMALAEIVAEVNAQIGNSAKSAAEVSLTMKRVLDSVSESTDATKATGEAVEEINKLTEQLRESVSGFQL